LRRKTNAYYCDTKGDKGFKIVHNKCDICNDRLICADNIESHIDMLDAIDDSYESEYDKSTHEQGPLLLLCGYCQKEYGIPTYDLTYGLILFYNYILIIFRITRLTVKKV
jgi:hypothetical protein